MNQFSHLSKISFPSSVWSIFMLALFSFYSYKNIFLQAKIGFELPAVSLITALNNFDIFVSVPSRERLDLYVSLAKTFDAYKKDYLQHYNDYQLLLNTYLALDGSHIALKYYAYKGYLNQDYKEHDELVLGTPSVEFNQNFYTSSADSTNRKINLVNNFYYIFEAINNKQKCDEFFNNYIYPLYKSQSSWKEVEIAASMAKALNHWTLINNLQISIFCSSLLLNAISLLVFIISEFSSQSLFRKINAFFFLIVFTMIYVAILIMIFICLSVKFFTGQSVKNVERLNNAGFIFFQFALLLIIGYFAVGWIIEFINLKHPSNNLNKTEDSLQGQLTELIKIPTEHNDIERGNRYNNYLSSSLNKAVTPFVQKIKRIITPKDTHHPYPFKKINSERMNTDSINSESTTENNINTIPGSSGLKRAAKSSVNVFDNQKSCSKESFNVPETLNLVSEITLNYPDVSPFSQISYDSDYSNSGVKISLDSKKVSNAESLVISPLNKEIQRFGIEQITRTLDARRKDFYQHVGEAAQLELYTPEQNGTKNPFLISTQVTSSFAKSFLNGFYTNDEQLKVAFKNKRRLKDVSGWDSNFGLQSSKFGASSSTEGSFVKSNSEKITQTQQQQHSTKNESHREKNAPEVRNDSESSYPSTTFPFRLSEATDTTNVNRYDVEHSVEGMSGDESLFSIERIAQGYRRSM